MNRRRNEIALSFCCLLQIAACGNGSSKGADGGGGERGTGGGTGTGGAGGPGGGNDAGGATGLCNTIPNGAPTVRGMLVAEDLPSNAAGGTIVPGTYFLTAATAYTGPGGNTGVNGSFRITIAINPIAGSADLDYEYAGSIDLGAEVRESFTVTPVGTSLTMNLTCDLPMPVGTFPYTATADGYLFFNTTQGRIDTYTRQP